MKNLKRKLSAILKFSVTIFILIYVFNKVDKASLYRIIKDVNKLYILLAFFVLMLQYFIAILRWKMLLKAVEIDIPARRIFLASSGSVFFSLLPFVSVIGGDIARGADLAHYTQRSKEVIATVFLDRLSGYVALVFLALIAFLLGDIQDATTLSFLLVIISVLVVVILVIFTEFFYSLVSRFLRSSKAGGVRDSLRDIHHEVHVFKHKKAVIGKNLLLSLLIQSCTPIMWMTIALSLGIQTKFIYFFIFTPIVTAVTMLPISVAGGLGIREYFTKLFFTKIGIAVDKALALSLINSFFVIAIGLIGGLIYVITVHHRRIQLPKSPRVQKDGAS